MISEMTSRTAETAIIAAMPARAPRKRRARRDRESRKDRLEGVGAGDHAESSEDDAHRRQHENGSQQVHLGSRGAGQGTYDETGRGVPHGDQHGAGRHVTTVANSGGRATPTAEPVEEIGPAEPEAERDRRDRRARHLDTGAVAHQPAEGPDTDRVAERPGVTGEPHPHCKRHTDDQTTDRGCDTGHQGRDRHRTTRLLRRRLHPQDGSGQKVGHHPHRRRPDGARRDGHAGPRARAAAREFAFGAVDRLPF